MSKDKNKQKNPSQTGVSRKKAGLKAGKCGKLIFWNKGGSAFRVKKDEIQSLICEHQPLAIGLVEANMSSNIHPATLLIDGYRLERDNLIEEGIRTRAAIYISDKVHYKRRRELEPPASPIIWIEINEGSSSTWLLGIGYREWRTLNPKTRTTSGPIAQQISRLNSWEKSWLSATDENKPIILLNDINADVAPWLDPDIALTDYQIKIKPVLEKVRDMAENCGFNLIRTGTTRHQGSNKASTLDIILTNSPHLIQNVTLKPSSSDHKVVILKKETKAVKSNQEIRVARSFKSYSKEKLLKQINIPMLNSLLMMKDPNLIANVLVTHITEAIDIVAPMTKIQRRYKYAPHLSLETKERMSERDQLKQISFASKAVEDELNFKKARNFSTQMPTI